MRKDKGAIVCGTCGVNAGITEERALSSGLDWVGYQGHPSGLVTCWACKNSHKSVMTERMAMGKPMGKFLDPGFFTQLRRENRFFAHQPITAYALETRRSL